MRVSGGSASVFALALFSIAGAPPVGAQVIEYTSRSAFQAATPSLSTFTFDGYASSLGYAAYPNGLTVQGVRFSGSGGRGVAVLDPKIGAGNPFDGHQFLTDGSNPDGITVSAFPDGTTAFGVDLIGFNGGGTITAIVDGQTFNVIAGNGMSGDNPVFLGFTSSTSLASISFMQVQQNGGFGVDIDNVSYGPAAVPEASTTVSFGLLLALGLGGAVVAARRKKAAA